MAVKYKEGESQESYEMADSIIKEHQDPVNNEFAKIKLEDIYFLNSTSDKPRSFIARMIKPNALFQRFTKKPLILEVNEDAFEPLSPDMRRIVIFHELFHIMPPEEDKKPYKLRAHDIQDFSYVLEVFGESIALNLHRSLKTYQDNMEAKIQEEKEKKKAQKKLEKENE